MAIGILRRIFEVAIGGACDKRVASPPAAFLNLDRSCRRARWVVANVLLIVADIQPILYPFHRIASHIVRANPAHAAWIRSYCRQSGALHHSGFAAVERVAPRIHQRLRPARRVFPFRLRRQSPAAPVGIRFSLVPGDLHTGVLWVLLGTLPCTGSMRRPPLEPLPPRF